MTPSREEPRQSVAQAVARMRAWAAAHPEADTQGLMDDEWEALARAAVGATPLRAESEHAMRFGPRTYTEAQQDTIREALANRKPLPEAPLPIEGEPLTLECCANPHLIYDSATESKCTSCGAMWAVWMIP